MSTTPMHRSPAYELDVELRAVRGGHHLQLVSFVPTARRPERQVKFQTVLSTSELKALQEAIENALGSLPQDGYNTSHRSIDCSIE